MTVYDLVVIGGGPGGYVAAIKAAQRGLQVCLVERDTLGGTCLNRGCIPTKSIIGSVEILEKIEKAEEMGVKIENFSFDFSRIMERKNKIVSQLRKGVEFLVKKNKVDAINGSASFIDTEHIRVATDSDKTIELKASYIIVATGSEPILRPEFNYDGENIVSSNEILEAKYVPKSLAIVGGGVIGCEFASIFNYLGAEVTILDVMDRILPQQDIEISKQLSKVYKSRRIDLKMSVLIKNINYYEDNNLCVITLNTGEIIEAEKVLLCTGRKPNTRDLNLQATGIETGIKGEIIVNKEMNTNVSHIYAIGDVTNISQLAHIASAQASIAVDNICGENRVMDYSAVPGCIFTFPEIAYVGCTKEQAEEKGYDVLVGSFPFSANGKALAIGESYGLVKIIADKLSKKILGAHIIGSHAADLITECTQAIQQGLTVRQIEQTIHVHPTLSEIVFEAVEDTEGLAVHK